jgi:TetR/AcrR family transcriptional regulator, mexJK operon transcriptional repressor
MNIGRPKDLEKRKQILQAAKTLFLKNGFHGSSMNQIAAEAHVTKLTVYNHFQDKVTLFTSAIAETCEESIRARPVNLNQNSDFPSALHEMCSLALQIINLPEAIKLEHLLLELAAEQNALVKPFFEASHERMCAVWYSFLEQAIRFNFIKNGDIEKQTQLLLSLLLGSRHHEVLLGVREIPNEDERQQIIEDAIEIFMLKYKVA